MSGLGEDHADDAVDGDPEALFEALHGGLDLQERGVELGELQLRDALLKRRNVNWARWIERRMAAPGSVFVAVGAGHLAGPDSVVTMLQRDGYRVRRIQ